jgi:hypothetical protein
MPTRSLLRAGAVLAETRGDRSISLIDEVWKSELGYTIYLHAPQGCPVDVDFSRDVLS